MGRAAATILAIRTRGARFNAGCACGRVVLELVVATLGTHVAAASGCTDVVSPHPPADTEQPKARSAWMVGNATLGDPLCFHRTLQHHLDMLTTLCWKQCAYLFLIPPEVYRAPYLERCVTHALQQVDPEGHVKYGRAAVLLMEHLERRQHN